MAARNAGTRPSDLAGIHCPNAALDFDLACTIRLNAHDLEREEMQAKRIAYEALKGFAGKGDEDADTASSKAPHWFGEPLFDQPREVAEGGEG